MAETTVVGQTVACDVRHLSIGVGLTILGGGAVGGWGCNRSVVRRRDFSGEPYSIQPQWRQISAFFPVDSASRRGQRDVYRLLLHPGGDSLMCIASFTSLSLVDVAVSTISTSFHSMCPSCHACSEVSNLASLQAALCSLIRVLVVLPVWPM